MASVREWVNKRYVAGQGVPETVAWIGIAASFVVLVVVYAALRFFEYRATGVSGKADDAHVKKSQERTSAQSTRHSSTGPSTPVPETVAVAMVSRHGSESPERLKPTERGKPPSTSSVSAAAAAAAVSSDCTSSPISLVAAHSRDCLKPVKNPQRDFQAFQISYLSVDLLCSFADWIRGAYTMAIYVEYGFSVSQVSVLFACSFFSSTVFGTLAGAVSDSLGRARMCRWYCYVFAASLLLTLVRNYYVLILSRLLAGVSTSLLATSFESYAVAQHYAHGFDPAWLPDLFSKTAILGSISAVVAGFVAEWSVRVTGNIGSILAPLPFLAAALFLMRRWPENYGDTKVPFYHTLSAGWRDVRRSRSLQLLWVSEALYEASLGIWLVLWTPALDYTNRQTPFGLVFATFTLCMVTGGLLARLIPLRPLLALAHVLGIASMLLPSFLFEHKIMVFAIFAVYELSTGIYAAAHPVLRSQFMSDNSRSAVMNIFRVPMNSLVVIALGIGPGPHPTLWFLTVLNVGSAVSLFLLRRNF